MLGGWVSEIDHRQSIYTTDSGRCYSQGFLSQSVAVDHVPAHHMIEGVIDLTWGPGISIFYLDVRES